MLYVTQPQANKLDELGWHLETCQSTVTDIEGRRCQLPSVEDLMVWFRLYARYLSIQTVGNDCWRISVNAPRQEYDKEFAHENLIDALFEATCWVLQKED